MSKVVMHNVVSVDGFIADDNDDVGPLFEWYFNGDQPLTAQDMADPAPGGMRVSKASFDYVRPMWDAINAMVIGRHLFDMTNGWEGKPPDRRPRGRGVAPAQARGLAPGGVLPLRRQRRGRGREGQGAGRGRHRRRGGGRRRRPGPRAGLVDEVAMDVVPVVFGSGKRYFGPVDAQHLLEDPDVVVQGDRVLHLRYRVRR